MAELETPPPTSMFREPLPEKTFPVTAVGIAVAAVVILAAVVFMLARRPAEPVANAAYAPNLSISDLQMSESDSQTGGKLIYIDGHVTNKGPATVTGIRVQVSFGNDQAMPAQVETVPMNMIYMREPYVDTRPLGASPLKPGGQADFRLIFDDVNDNWNQQLPQLQMTQIVTK